jgi:hypothetical protein
MRPFMPKTKEKKINDINALQGTRKSVPVVVTSRFSLFRICKETIFGLGRIACQASE